MSFKQRIKEIRLQNKLTKVEMAKKLNVSEGTIRMWENGSNEPRMGAVENICKTFNLSKNYVLGLDEVEVDNLDNEISIDFYGKVSAGNFEDIPVDEGTLKVPSSIFRNYDPKNCIGLQVNGDSMNKVLSNGSFVVVVDYRRTQEYTLNSNDILVLRIGNEYTIKKVRKTETKIHLEPMSFSDEFKTNTFDIENSDQIEVIGKVIFNYQIFD